MHSSSRRANPRLAAMRGTWFAQGRRLAWGVFAVVLGLSASSCPAPPKHQAPNLHLVDLAGTAQLDPGVPIGLPAGAEVDWVRGGVAMLSLPLPSADGAAVPGIERLHVWQLPLARMELARGGDALPRVEGLELEYFAVGSGKAASGEGGTFQVRGDECFVQLREGQSLPPSLRLHYPVPAVLVAGSQGDTGIAAGEVVALRHLTEDVVEDAFAIQGGSTLRVTLPILAAGRLMGDLSAVSVRGVRGGEVVVRVSFRMGSDELGTLEVDSGAERLPFEFTLERLHRPGVLEIQVEGPSDAVVFLGAPRHSRARTDVDPKNLVLILVDTLRADRLGVYGSGAGLTPNLDILARDAITFTQCWSTASWTLPSVATMLTSLHSGQHGASLNDRRLGEGVSTLPELMRRGGYQTAAFTDGAFLSPAFGLDRGFATFDATGGGVEAVVERARAWLEDAGEGPWFLFLHTYEVHSPYEPPPEAYEAVMARHKDGLFGRRPEPQAFYDLADEPEKRAAVARVLSDLYDEELRYTDRVLGTFLDDLRERGLFEETAIAVTSDHGEEFGEHGLFGHGDTLYVEQLHVPLLLRLPRGLRGGERDQRPVSHFDLAPTLLDAAGSYDLRLESTFIGDSLLRAQAPSVVYAVRNEEETGMLHAARRGARAWIQGKYIYDRGQNRQEHYNLSVDPHQKRNRTGEDPQADREGRLLLGKAARAFGKVRTTDSMAEPGAAQEELSKLGYFDSGED